MPNQYTVNRLAIIPVGPSIAYIPLTQGLFALIDSEDADRVQQHNWYAQGVYRGRPYAESWGQGRLHNFLHAPKDGMETDHANGNTLDDRKANLRDATQQQQRFNSCVQRDSVSGLKGISFSGGKWQARISVGGKRKSLGLYSTPQLAHAAYMKAATEIHGDFFRIQA